MNTEINPNVLAHNVRWWKKPSREIIVTTSMSETEILCTAIRKKTIDGKGARFYGFVPPNINRLCGGGAHSMLVSKNESVIGFAEAHLRKAGFQEG